MSAAAEESSVPDGSCAPAVVDRALEWLDRVVTVFITALLLADAGLMTAAIVSRAAFDVPITWVYELGMVLLVAIAFLGAVSAFHRNEHIGMKALVGWWPAPWRPAVETIAVTLVAVFAGVGVWQTVLVLRSGLGSMPMSGLSNAFLYVPILIGLGLIGVLAVIRFVRAAGAHQLAAIATLAMILGAGFLVRAGLVNLAAHAPMSVAAAVFVACMATGLPLAFDFGITTLVLLRLQPGMVLTALPLQMAGGVNSFVLLALPFFILTGGLLTSGGIAARLLRFLDDVTGTWHGGSAMAGVVGMYLFSGLSGAKIADIAAVGPVLAPNMKAQGYSDGELVGVLSASAAMGESVPPSLAILVLTAVTSVSTGALFLAGLVPAAAVGLFLLALIYVRARVVGISRQSSRPGARVVAGHLLQALLPAGMPVIIFGGIIGGVATPIEASALAVAYGLLLSAAIYRVPLRELSAVAASASRLSAMLLFLLATTAAFVWVITEAGVAQDLQSAATIFAGNKIAFMLATIALLIVTGSIFEGLPAIVIFGPLLLPIATAMGIDALQYSVVIVMAMGVGNFLPPVGIGYFAACSIVGTRPEGPVRMTMLYMAAALVGIALIAAVPAITTFLPRLAGVKGG